MTRGISWRHFGAQVLAGLLAAVLLVPMAADAAGMGGGGGMATITAVYVPGANGLNPADSSWSVATATTITLVRDIDYVSNATTDDTMCMMLGTAINRPVTVRAVHDGSNIFFRYEWGDATEDLVPDNVNKFADAFAMEIPYGAGGAPLAMGSQTAPVNIIFWRADLSQPQNIVAGGIGTPQPSPDAQDLSDYQGWSGGVWTVIVERPLTGASVNQVSLARGGSYQVAFANWNGSALNRNGRKAISSWNTLRIQ